MPNTRGTPNTRDALTTSLGALRFSRGFKVERRGSRATRPSLSPSSPCSPEPQEPEKDAWLVAWEDRLKLREATLESRGVKFPRSRATPVLNLECSSCHHHLSWQGMQAYFKNTPDVDIYSSDQQPDGIMEAEADLNHGMCGCHVREFDCSCGLTVGYRMHNRCENCRAANDEDEGHCWFFQANCVEAEPRTDSATGETLMWPGFDFPDNYDSSLEESRCAESRRYSIVDDDPPDFFDENSIVQHRQSCQEGECSPSAEHSPLAGWDCSPLAERNGRRPRVSFGKPSNPFSVAKEAECAQKEAALTALEEELMTREAANFEADMNQAAREKHLRDATAQQESTDKGFVARESEIAARETVLRNTKLALDVRQHDLREQEQALLEGGADEATKRALHRSEQRNAICDAEADALRGQLAGQKRVAITAQEKVASQSSEIQLLHSALAEARRINRNSTDWSAGVLMGQGRMPQATASALPKQLMVRTHDLDGSCLVAERILSAERDELAFTKMELQKARQQLECDPASRMQAACNPSQSANNAEMDRLRRERDIACAEVAQLRPDVDRLRAESLRSGAARPESDDFAQARLEMAKKLSETRVKLDRREEAIVAREAELDIQRNVAWEGSMPARGAVEPVMMPARRLESRMMPPANAGFQPVQLPWSYGGCGAPEAPGIWQRLGCARRFAGL